MTSLVYPLNGIQMAKSTGVLIDNDMMTYRFVSVGGSTLGVLGGSSRISGFSLVLKQVDSTLRVGSIDSVVECGHMCVPRYQYRVRVSI